MLQSSPRSAMNKPQELYWQAGPWVRQMPNRTIITKLNMDGDQIMGDELAGPFDVLMEAGRAYARRAYYRARTAASRLPRYDGRRRLATRHHLDRPAIPGPRGTGSSKSVMREQKNLYKELADGLWSWTAVSEQPTPCYNAH
jgi:hypothetical protein